MKRIATLFLLALLPSAAGAVDKPGEKILLKPSDLPKPYASPAVANKNDVIPRPAGVMPRRLPASRFRSMPRASVSRASRRWRPMAMSSCRSAWPTR